MNVLKSYLTNGLETLFTSHNYATIVSQPNISKIIFKKD